MSLIMYILIGNAERLVLNIKKRYCIGVFKDINDSTYDNIIERLVEEGYDELTDKDNSEIVDLIGSSLTEDEIFHKAIKIINKNMI